jgi:hypothetical protein
MQFGELRTDFAIYHPAAYNHFMSDYETSTTISGDGEIHLIGLPFEPGTEVGVVVSPKNSNPPTTDVHRLAALLSALDCAHNTEPIGTLKRNELYDRDTFR